MQSPPRLVLFLLATSALLACGSEPSASSELEQSFESESEGSRSEREPARQAPESANAQREVSPGGSDSELADAVRALPDRATDPIGHLYSRTELMIQREDTDGDGALTFEEWGGPLAPEEEKRRLFERKDLDVDGKLTLEEFITDFMTEHPDYGG